MKMLKVGDIHLHTKEMRSTKKLVENNVAMLKGIYNVLVDDEEIKLLIFMGDIQHATPKGENTLEEVSKWDYWFKKIGMLMAERYLQDDVTILETPQEGELSIVERIEQGLSYPVFTLKGNHDIDNKVDFTYFDDAVKKGWFTNPEGLVIEGVTQINFHNYGDAKKVYEKQEGVEQVIGLYHDVIATEESPFWIGKHPAYPVEEVLDGIDLGVIGHIHTKSDPIIINTVSGGRAVSWTMGSMGRTAFAEGQIRDVGYCGLIDTNDITQLGTVEIDLIPADEYFNYRGEMRRRETQRAYDDFSLGMEETTRRPNSDPRDDIRRMEGLDTDVIAVCLEIMDEVMG